MLKLHYAVLEIFVNVEIDGNATASKKWGRLLFNILTTMANQRVSQASGFKIQSHQI